MLGTKALLFAAFLFMAGISIGYVLATDPQIAQAINVVGGETINTNVTSATFKVFKTSETTLQTDATTVNAKLLGMDKGQGDKIAAQASIDLEFLNNVHQTLADLQVAFPCPGIDCDPDIETDPATCSIFWEDLDKQVDHPFIPDEPADTLTSRNTIITITWDGTIYIHGFADPSAVKADYPNNC